MKDPRTLRIVFMGTPEFAVESLKKLVEGKYNVVAVVTVPDKPAGRGQKVKESDVKKFAVLHNLPVLQPEKLKAPEFIEQLKSFQPDLQIVVAFRMLPEMVWQLPPLGTFNLHGSLLPHYRGAAPINRAIMNGEKKTGVTTFFLQQEIDTGNIIFREDVEIGEDENAGDIHDKLMYIGADLVLKTVDAIAIGNYPQTPQSNFLKPGEEIKTAPKIFREDCKIDWTWPGEKIHNHIRGLSPYPAAWTELKKENSEPINMKIYKAKFFPFTVPMSAENISQKIRVKVSGGTMEILELQIPGKKKMGVAEFLRGNKIDENYSFT
jgi:methionyl-tRNA formyltransferase